MSLCECGCGQLAPIAKMTNAARGHVKGLPVRYIVGHAWRGRQHTSEEKAKIKRALTGRKLSPEHRAKISERLRSQIHHGHSRRGQNSPTYRSWLAMRRRCEDHNFKQFADYGGRGISVCEAWRQSFATFLADMGERPSGRTLDRIDPDGPYQRDNCRWATPLEQRHNRRVAL